MVTRNDSSYAVGSIGMIGEDIRMNHVIEYELYLECTVIFHGRSWQDDVEWFTLSLEYGVVVDWSADLDVIYVGYNRKGGPM